MRYRLRLGAAVLLAGCGLAAASCGYGVKEERLPETGATLEGTITYGTEKVPAALVIVTGANGTTATGNVDEVTGRYKVENVPIGEVKIGVNTDAAEGQLRGKMTSGYYKGPEAKAKGITAPPALVKVHPRYANPDTSGLRTTTQGGANTYDIKIPR
jgi:hypothetical protein